MPQVNKNNYNKSNKNKKSNTSNSSSDRNSKIWPEENQWTTWKANENEGGQMTNRRAKKIHEQIGKSQWTTRKTKENSGKPWKMKGKPLQTKIKKIPKRKKKSPNNCLPILFFCWSQFLNSVLWCVFVEMESPTNVVIPKCWDEHMINIPFRTGVNFIETIQNQKI